MDPVNILSFSVISAFCVGRQRQQITAGAFLATSKNSDEFAVFKMLVSAGPSTNRTCVDGSYSINFVLRSYDINTNLPARPILELRRFIG